MTQSIRIAIAALRRAKRGIAVHTDPLFDERLAAYDRAVAHAADVLREELGTSCSLFIFEGEYDRHRYVCLWTDGLYVRSGALGQAARLAPDWTWAPWSEFAVALAAAGSRVAVAQRELSPALLARLRALELDELEAEAV